MFRMAQRSSAIPRAPSSDAAFALYRRFSFPEYEERVAGEISQHGDGDGYENSNVGPEEGIHSLGRAEAIHEEGDDADVHKRSGG